MKPKVICHIMSSVDGKILVDRWSAPSGESSKGELMGEYARIGKDLHTDAWTFGKNTITEIFPEKFTPKSEYSVQHETTLFKGKLLSPRMFISIDPDADIIYPGIDGTSDSRSIFDYVGKGRPVKGQSLKLLDIEKEKGGVVWLRYKIQKQD